MVLSSAVKSNAKPVKVRVRKALKSRKSAKVVNLQKYRESRQPGLSPRVREELVLKYQEKARKIAFSILRRWRARIDLQEVHSVVDLSLCEAVKNFNPNRGANFTTFLFYHLRGNLIRTVTSLAKHGSVPLTEMEGSEREGRRETHGVSAAEVAEALTSRDGLSPDEFLMKKELLEASREACAKLDPLEREVLERVFINEEQLTDVANSMGYSRCHISRVKRKALEALEKNLSGYLAVERAVEPVRKATMAVRKIVHRRRPRSQSAKREEEKLRAVA